LETNATSGGLAVSWSFGGRGKSCYLTRQHNMAIVFPPSPALNDLYPANPGTSGVSQYQWDGTKWNAVTSMVSLGVANQGAFNNYTWPLADGTTNHQLTTDGAGNLSWDVPAAPSLQVLSLLEPFDGTNVAFTLVEFGTTTPFTPNPSTNLVIFLGGVPQVPVSAFTTAGNTVTFTEAPLAGTTFYAISTIA